LPTLWGWLLLLVVLALAAVIAGRQLDPFLAINEPSGGKILVIEGWMDPHELDQAVEVFRKGSYQLAVATGAPVAEWPQGTSIERLPSVPRNTSSRAACRPRRSPRHRARRRRKTGRS
jgi:hypothetical protein